MSIIPPDPGATADSIVPPWPVRLLDQLQEVSTELGRLAVAQPEHPELGEAKADVDRAIARLRLTSASE